MFLSMEEFCAIKDNDPRFVRVETESGWPLWRCIDPAHIREGVETLARLRSARDTRDDYPAEFYKR